MGVVDGFRHDASSLYKFIDSVVTPLTTRAHLSYISPSEEFFNFILSLGLATKAHVAELSRELNDAFLAASPTDFQLRAQELATLRYAWFELHKFIKPASDAHTLASPVSLVSVLTHRLRRVSEFENVRFAVVHTSDLNYFQLQSNYVRQLASQISAIVSINESFPEDLAIVGLPYSQATSLFLNVLLAHEMGHFSFQKKNERKRLLATLLPVINSQPIGAFSQQDIARCVELVMTWLEEIYCDLFALSLAGPAFAFAFIELLALTRTTSSGKFSASHPAIALRLREQARLLKDQPSPWWDQLSSNHYSELLSQSSSLDDSTFFYKGAASGSPEQIALECLLLLVEEPKRFVRELFPDAALEIASYCQHSAFIKQYFEHGVVPSRLVTDSEVLVPDSMTLLNASYSFYLNDLPLLLDRISGAERDCLDCRAFWTNRVEMWTVKALEDVITNGYTLQIPY